MMIALIQLFDSKLNEDQFLADNKSLIFEIRIDGSQVCPTTVYRHNGGVTAYKTLHTLLATNDIIIASPRMT